jgi:flagellar motor switch protein FliN/FliY
MSSSQTSSSSSERELLDTLVGPLADVVCPVSVQLGTGRVTLRQLLTLTRNTVLRLSQPAGEDLQVIVYGTPIASAEIMIVDESTALRVTQICQPATGRDTA